MATNPLIDEVFDLLGGPTAVARILGVGGPSTASEMKRRGSIPSEYWAALITEAQRQGGKAAAVVTPDALVRAHARPSDVRPYRRRVPARASA